MVSYKISNYNKSNKHILEIVGRLEHGLLSLFLSSVQKVIMNSLKNMDETKLIFDASNLETLESVLKKDMLTYDQSLCMIGCLSKQLLFLNERNISWVGLGLSDILVLNDLSLFVVASPANLHYICKNRTTITFEMPFCKPTFISPLVEWVDSIPSSVTCVVDRCSLAKIVIHSMGILDLETIHGTKMYWFLKRCLEHYEGRMILI
jgi:hypothetical protein